MRKQFIMAFLMLIWLCQLSGRYFVMLDFYINQEFIAKNLCINRNNPGMKCNGHCQLKRKLSEEEKKEQESPERRTDNRSEIFYAACFYQDSLKPLFRNIIRNHQYPHSIGTPVDQPSAVFHPPMV